jgi:hypothetical protein
MAAASQALPQSRALWTSQKDQLSSVRSPSFDLGIWVRTLSPALRMRFAARAAKPLEVDVTFERGDLGIVKGAFSAAVDDAELEAFLHTELEELLPLFDATLSAPRLRVRLDRIVDSMCAKLHTDCLKLRLACTYAGPGTEWVDDVDADRGMLGRADLSVDGANAAILRHDDALRRCGIGDVILLKGSEWNESEQGAIHRSPQFTGQGRILLRIDEPETRP